MRPNVFQEQHRVTYYETDRNDRMSLKMLLNIVLLVSEDQSDHLRIGSETLQAQKLGWVVIQYSIKINRLPRTNEIVNLMTSSTAYNRFMANRNFTITDSKGQVEVKVASDWVAINLQTRQLATLRPALVKPYGGKQVKLLPHLKRPQAIKNTDHLRMKNYRTRYSDIDLNHHVNNSCYLDWATDVLSPQFLTNYQPYQVGIRFRDEVKYGMMVTSRARIIRNPDNVITKHEIRSNNKLNAVANIFWQKNKE